MAVVSSTLFKVSLGIFLVAVIAVGGAAIGGAFSSNSNSEDKTTWHALSKEINENNRTQYENKIGGKYKNYLVGTFGGEKELNKNWWNKVSYVIWKNSQIQTPGRISKDLSTKFTKEKVEEGYYSQKETDKTKSLNKVCDGIYKEELTSISSDSTQGDKHKIWQDLWDFCSDLDTAPVFIKESNNLRSEYQTKSNSIGKKQESVLLSTLMVEEIKLYDNKILWELKQKEFFEDSETPTPFFKAIKENLSNKNKEHVLRKRCHEAYALEPANGTETESSPLEANVAKYCSLNGSVAS